MKGQIYDDADNAAMLTAAKGKTIKRIGWGKSEQEFLLEFTDGQTLRLFVNLYEEIDVCWMDVPARTFPLRCSECGRVYKTLETFMRHKCAQRMRDELSAAIDGNDKGALREIIDDALSGL